MAPAVPAGWGSIPNRSRAPAGGASADATTGIANSCTIFRHMRGKHLRLRLRTAATGRRPPGRVLLGSSVSGRILWPRGSYL
jgi:hypothetical protein